MASIDSSIQTDAIFGAIFGLDKKLIPILPGWYRPPMPVYTVVSNSSWMLRRVRIFAEWFNEEAGKETKQEGEAVREFFQKEYGYDFPVIS